MERLRLAVIGVGHLGKEHARILAGLPDVELIGVVDARAEQAEAIARRWATRPFTDHHRLLDERPDAVIVAVPTTHHHAVAVDCLQAGVSLLVEKPLTASLDEADELVTLARQASVVLQVGHVERFNPSFEELARRPLQPKLVQCQRFSPFSGRSLDIGVVLDLMIHDLDLLLSLVRAPVRDVSAVGLSLLGGHEDLAQARITFENGCIAQLAASRVHTGPVRRMEVWAPEGFIAADFHRRRLSLIQPSAQLWQQRGRRQPLDAATLAVLRNDLFGHYLHEAEVDCAGDGPDQLTRELTEFVATVRSGAPLRVPGEQGRDALALACRILDSLRGHGWDGQAEGPTGPANLPPPRGMLFRPHEPDVAA
jgi:predicted dehydrogenase